MKQKLFMLLAVTTMATAGMSARELRRLPLNASQMMYECQLDSIYQLTMDSTVDCKYVIYAMDTLEETVEVTIRGYEYSAKDGNFEPLILQKNIYNLQGKILCELSAECSEGSFVPDAGFLNDSVVYVYDNQTVLKLEYYSADTPNDFKLNDSTFCQYDEMDSLVYRVEYMYEAQRMKEEEKQICTYDPVSHLKLTDSIYSFNTDWVLNKVNHYVIEEGKYTAQYTWNLKENKKDTLWRAEYVYDANDRVAQVIGYKKTMKTWSTNPMTVFTYTYNDCGDVENTDTYGYDTESQSLTYCEGTHMFYSSKETPMDIKNVDEDSQKSKVESQKSKVESQKYIENGQLIIKRNNIRYNAQGQVVK